MTERKKKKIAPSGMVDHPWPYVQASPQLGLLDLHAPLHSVNPSTIWQPIWHFLVWGLPNVARMGSFVAFKHDHLLCCDDLTVNLLKKSHREPCISSDDRS